MSARRFVQGGDCRQQTVVLACLDDEAGEENAVRVVDILVDQLDRECLAFEGIIPAPACRPVNQLAGPLG